MIYGKAGRTARYTFPLAAIVCILVGLGLPGNFKLGVALSVLLVITIGMISVPLALEHKANPPIGQKLTSYVKVNLNPVSSVLIISDEVPALTFFMTENAPNLPDNATELQGHFHPDFPLASARQGDLRHPAA